VNLRLRIVVITFLAVAPTWFLGTLMGFWLAGVFGYPGAGAISATWFDYAWYVAAYAASLSLAAFWPLPKSPTPPVEHVVATVITTAPERAEIGGTQ
jgi:hypothetical protein